MSKKPFVQFNGFNGATFNIDGKTKPYSVMELFKMKNVLDSHLKNCSHMWAHLEYYKDYGEARIEQRLKEQEDGIKTAQDYLEQDEEFEYSIGDNYADYIKTSTGVMSDNHKAAKIIKKEYTKQFGKNTLVFDSEMSYCYVYTKDKKEAKQFMLFVYEKYIKPYLEPWCDGFDNFTLDIKNSSDVDLQLFKHLSW